MLIDLGDENKFVPYGTNNEKNCLDLCKSIMKKYGLKEFGSPNNVFKLMYENNGELKYYGNNIRENYKLATQCIDRHLENGRPIIVGVNYELNRKINEGATDHFVVIYGKGFDESLNCFYYTYYEVGRSSILNGYNNDLNRLIYVDSDEPLLYNPKSNLCSKKRYDVTQIRPNDGILDNTIKQ